jgi:F0F1-type ATP synthase gamma subunit
VEFDNLPKEIDFKEMKERTEKNMEGYKKGLLESIHEVAKDYKNLVSCESDQ